jgi:hypothetical protein
MKVNIEKRMRSHGKRWEIPDQALDVTTLALKLLSSKAKNQLIAIRCQFKGNPFNCVSVVKLVMRSNREGLPQEFTLIYEERFQIGHRCLRAQEMQEAIEGLLKWAVKKGYSY